MTIISIETLKNGKRVVNFREWPNESENNNYSIEHFGCSENDTDEEVLDAAEQWFIDTWGEDAEYEIEYPKNKKTESKNNVAIKGANSLYENYVRLFGETPGGKKVLKEGKRVNAQIAKQIKNIADAERKGGGTVEINSRLPSVSVTNSNGDEYFFQGDEAEDLLDEVPHNVNPEDYILYVSTGW